MSTNIDVRIEMRTPTGYKKIELFQSDFSRAQLWPWNGTHDLFDILSGSEDFTYYSNHYPIACAYTKEELDMDTDYAQVYVTTLADLELYAEKNPVVPDWDNEEGGAKRNPMYRFATAIRNYVEFAGEVVWCPSDVRILYTFC